MARLTTSQEEKIERYLREYYEDREFPALRYQYEVWRQSRPLEGMRVLEATPIFRNTLAKYLALSLAGAEVMVSVSPEIMSDASIVASLPDWGIGVTRSPELEGCFDVILDCAGGHSALEPEVGYVELTRSGVEKYEDAVKPVFLADAGRIKEIETCLGTGESFLRAMRHFGYADLRGRLVVVFGYGKVGRGVVMYALKAGARVAVVDALDKSEQVPEGVDFVLLEDHDVVKRVLNVAFCLVTVTGVRHALHGKVDWEPVLSSGILLTNMGVEDEYGPEVPDSRVLNGKFSLNFALPEPTLMRYIETTMALDNAGAVELATGRDRYQAGIIKPSPELENLYLDIVRREGLIADELLMAGL